MPSANRSPLLYIFLLFVFLVAAVIWWNSRQTETTEDVQVHTPPSSGESPEQQVPVIEVTPAVLDANDDQAENAPSNVTDSSEGESDTAALTPGQVSEAEIIAEGLTPAELETELNIDTGRYPYKTEYILVPPGVQSIPGDPNAR